MRTNLTVVNGKITYPPEENAISILDIKPHIPENSGFVLYDESAPDKIICCIGYIETRKKEELKYKTEEEYRGKGYMTEAMTWALTWARNNGVKGCLWLLIDEGNKPSLRIAQKFGFLPQEETIGLQRWYCLNLET